MAKAHRDPLPMWHATKINGFGLMGSFPLTYHIPLITELLAYNIEHKNYIKSLTPLLCPSSFTPSIPQAANQTPYTANVSTGISIVLLISSL